MDKYYRAFDVERIIKLVYAEELKNKCLAAVSFILGEILNLPTIDIVCCKDCIYWQEWNDEHFCNNGYGLHSDTVGYDFCSYGERRI